MKKKIYYLFLFLLIYVLAQSVWWMYRLVVLSNELYTVREMQTKYFQIAGEGIIFFFVVCIGFWLTYRSVKKEMKLTNQQRNFLLAITHELKTPIASLKLYLQTLALRSLTPEKQKEILEKTIIDSDRLNSLVENILLATKLDDKAMPFQREEINLSELVQTTTIQILEGNPKPIEIDFLIAPDLKIFGDKEALISVITNLVDNGIKYSDKGGHMAVHVIDDDDKVLFRVTDEGIGISEKERKKIFKKFYRSGDENTRKSKGTGLGLYIVKTIVDGHGGLIMVEPNKIKGTIFTCGFYKG